jgi:hypothetical protein
MTAMVIAFSIMLAALVAGNGIDVPDHTENCGQPIGGFVAGRPA